MSDDLISRQAAIKAVGYYCLHSGDKLLFADKPLKELPTAQPERKRGKWVGVNVGNGTTRYTCSECGQSYECDSREAWDFIYCPKCGMEGTP